MALAYSSAGTGAGGSTSVGPTYPVLVGGEFLVLHVVNKYPTNEPTTPTGWTLLRQDSGGNGSSGADSGDVYSTLYYRIGDVLDSLGTVTVTVTSGNSTRARIFAFTMAAGKTIGLGVCGGTDTTTGVDWSVTGDADNGVTTNDLVAIFTGTNSDNGTVSGHAVTQTGVTYGTVTERGETQESTGDDCSISLATAPVTAGPSSAAPVYTATRSASGANSHCGVSQFVRLREIDPQGAGTADGTSSSSAAGASLAASSGTAAGTSTADGVGDSTGGGSTAAGTADGTSSAAAVGASISAAAGTADGTSTASATAPSSNSLPVGTAGPVCYSFWNQQRGEQ